MYDYPTMQLLVVQCVVQCDPSVFVRECLDSTIIVEVQRKFQNTSDKIFNDIIVI